MSHKTKFEFFPEIEFHPLKTSENKLRQKVIIFPTRESLRMLTYARNLKRKYMHAITRAYQSQDRYNIILLKRYTGLRGYRQGKKTRLKTVPTLILDRKLICYGNLPPKKELDAIVEEILVDIIGTKISSRK